MWKKWKESELYKRMKEMRVNRAVYLSAVVILLALAVVLAITAATNRAKKDAADKLPADTQQSQNTPTPEPDKKPENTPVISESVPELALPVSGKLAKAHSVDVQVFSETMKDWRVHLGIDIATEENAPVCAVADGSVAQIWEDPMMGWCVAVSHTGDCMTVYKNLAAELAQGLEVGCEVRKGELLGHVGDSALIEIADEPHLHMEMTVKGLQVDPLDYFSSAVLKTLTDEVGYEESTGK